MAFLVGVREPRASRTPPPGAPRSLSPAVELEARLALAGLSDGAPPSPLKGEAGHAVTQMPKDSISQFLSVAVLMERCAVPREKSRMVTPNAT